MYEEVPLMKGHTMDFQEGQSSSEQHATISLVQEHVPDSQDCNPQNKPQNNQFIISGRI